MNYAAISELGMLLEYVLNETKICAKDRKKSCRHNKIINWALKQSKKLQGNLKNRKSTSEYIKHTAQMFHQVMLGIRDLAEHVRPHGLQCYVQNKCKASEELVTRRYIQPLFSLVELHYYCALIGRDGSQCCSASTLMP